MRILIPAAVAATPDTRQFDRNAPHIGNGSMHGCIHHGCAPTVTAPATGHAAASMNWLPVGHRAGQAYNAGHIHNGPHRPQGQVRKRGSRRHPGGFRDRNRPAAVVVIRMHDKAPWVADLPCSSGMSRSAAIPGHHVHPLQRPIHCRSQTGVAVRRRSRNTPRWIFPDPVRGNGPKRILRGHLKPARWPRTKLRRVASSTY